MSRSSFFPFAAVALLLCLATMPEGAAPRQRRQQRQARPTPPARPVRSCRQGHHHTQGTPGLQSRRRLLPGQLPAADKLLGQARKESDRLKVVEIGKTEEGRPSPHGHRDLAGQSPRNSSSAYKEIARRLALAEA